MSEWLSCITCHRRYDVSEIRYTCDCGGLLSVERDPIQGQAGLPVLQLFEERRASRKAIDSSGVWRFREAVLSVPEEQIVTHPEGSTRLYEREGLLFKHEGENPTGSFKDRGMTVAMTQAVRDAVRRTAL